MSKSSPRHLAALILLSICAFPLTVAAQFKEAYISDDQIKQHILSSGIEIVESGSFTPNETLQTQLNSRRQIDRALPPEGQMCEQAEGIYDKACAATVVIVNLVYVPEQDDYVVGEAGSGFIVSPDGLVVTNYHVMGKQGAVTFVAMLRDGRIVPVLEVMAGLKEHDVAIVRLGKTDEQPLPVMPIARDAEVGERVHIVGHPDHRFWRYSSGHIARFFGIVVLRGGPVVPRMDTTAQFAKGSSGGPVMNDFGQVVGVVSSSDTMHAGEKDGIEIDVQLVFRDCVPYETVLAMFVPEPEDSTDESTPGDEADTPADESEPVEAR